ncbi:tripartite tricarboxylate transporter substrate binding protein [Ramlibacter sp. RBP-2]|uniref:Tripartite tricarboxylate transporter substrate binding protein n=1 Tax=Ramlibacter lithotrophicus TaxID=2606681 RepID=A0A7X6DJ31_9BURK|nr:tripartite tricarboxylate transporter substrate binding protein [Ramlibacter lithotrophicus]NKE68055.1 tripartite tricarboxylate transporter substrate binding protein [Ramlibacter lithotrophicus]
MLNRRELLAAGAAAAASTFAPAALAQAFPSRPVKIVVPWTAGGTGDIQARLIGQHMSQTLGQPVVVENKPGGGTVIATALVAKAPADGHTLLLMANSFVINAKLHASLPYDGIRAFDSVACLTNSPQVIAVNAASPYKSFKDWVDAARAKPGTISYATVGPATTQHIAGEMLQRAAGIKLIYTPFGGGAPAVQAVLAGHVDTVLANLSEMNSFLEAGKMRPLAVTTLQRLESLKNVPTVAESGIAGYEAAAWFGLVAPKGTPADAVAKIADAARRAMADAEVRKKLQAIGLDSYLMDPPKFAAHIADQFARYSKVIDEAGIKA